MMIETEGAGNRAPQPDLRAEMANFLGEKRLLVDAMVRDSRRGVPAKTIARHVAEAFSRDQVMQFLTAVALHDAARTALAAAGLQAVVSVSYTGIENRREARIVLAADPPVTPDPGRFPGGSRALCGAL